MGLGIRQLQGHPFAPTVSLLSASGWFPPIHTPLTYGISHWELRAVFLDRPTRSPLALPVVYSSMMWPFGVEKLVLPWAEPSALVKPHLPVSGFLAYCSPFPPSSSAGLS